MLLDLGLYLRQHCRQRLERFRRYVCTYGYRERYRSLTLRHLQGWPLGHLLDYRIEFSGIRYDQ